ncbi:MAG: polyprenyl synthetase family protein [Acidobacteria bacterium]|nr:polyprenyl synthetase family protein [Acidobacteriota bacterium]
MNAPSPLALRDYVASLRSEVERELTIVLPGVPACPAVIADAMRYSLFAGGKRFRPILTLAAAEAVRPHAATTRALAMPAACAIEMIHTYSLIHDDLPAMDNDTMRRGKPTLHVVYGEGMAILAGDALLAEAFALLARLPVDAGDGVVALRKLAAINRIAEAAGSLGMVGGQAIDLLAAGHAADASAMDADGLRDMHARKTGALIRASAVAGAIMAGGSPEQIGAVDRYATGLGLAFQIVDDVLDVVGDGSELGKTVGKDAAANKPTYPAMFGLDESKRLAGQAADAAVGALAGAHLHSGRLAEIAQWVVSRTS